MLRISRNVRHQGAKLGMIEPRTSAVTSSHVCGPCGSGDRIFFEQSGDHCRVEISANAHDFLILEKDDPAIAIIEPHSVLGCRQGMQFDNSLIVFDDEVLHMKLRPLWKHLAQLGKGASNKACLASVVACERVCPHHGPSDVVGDMGEKGGAVPAFEAFEDFTDTLGCDGHETIPLPTR
jgi:hypothetical protein